jgi:hypothetical protein
MVASTTTAARRAAKPLSRALDYSATPWRLYESARSNIAAGRIDLELGTFRVALFTRSSNCGSPNRAAFAELTGELKPGVGYRSGGETFSTWMDGNAQSIVFGSEGMLGNWVAKAPGLSASFAVVYQDDHDDRPLLCVSRLGSGRQDLRVAEGMRLSLAAPVLLSISARA